MAIRRVRPGKVLVGTQFSRRDFLKLSGTGLAGAALLGTAGCGSIFEGGGGGGSAQKTDTLNINLLTEVPDLNSATTTDSTSFNVITNLMEGLYRLDPDQNPKPATAEGVEIRCDSRNHPSVRLAERAGFLLEGTLQNNEVGTDGSARDTLMFALTPEHR